MYQAIIREESLALKYQSFKAKQPSEFIFYPYLLKEFKNRWFIIGIRKQKEGFMNLALDRIISVSRTGKSFVKTVAFDPEQYFKNVIGVSVSPTVEPAEVVLWVTRKHAPYVLTKPLHHTQKELERDSFGVTISLHVQHNFELEKEILAFGDGMKVISPSHLKRNIKSRLKGGLELYETDLSKSGMEILSKKLEHKGSGTLEHVYGKKEVSLMRKLVGDYFKDDQNTDSTHAVRRLLEKIPQLSQVLFNKNLRRILSVVDPGAFLVKAMYFDKPAESNWYVTWHQDVPINVREKIETPGYSGWTNRDGVISVSPPEEVNHNRFAVRVHLDDTDQKNGALRVIEGSHRRQFNDEELQLIAQNSVPSHCEVFAGGIHLMKPLLLHASYKSVNHKPRRVIHLEFASVALAGALEWAERAEIGI